MTRQRVHSVIVDLAGDDLAYQSMCREGDTVPPLATFRKPAHLSQVRALSEGLSCALSARSGSKDAGIRDWGSRLYDQLIPADLAAKLQSDGAESYLVLYLDPELIWIPWELLWDGNGFLCLRHRVARLLQKTANELRFLGSPTVRIDGMDIERRHVNEPASESCAARTMATACRLKA